MIVGTILDVSLGAEPATNSMNGSAMMQFYSMDDAKTWALTQSKQTQVGTTYPRCLTTVINCRTGERHWYFNGVKQN